MTSASSKQAQADSLTPSRRRVFGTSTRTSTQTAAFAAISAIAVATLFALGAPLQPAAAQSLLTLRNIEKSLLESKLEEFQAAHEADVEAARNAAAASAALRSSLGDLSVPVERLRQLESRLAAARGIANQRAEHAASLRNDIYDRMERLALLESELDDVGASEWGTYSLDFGPDEGPGRLILRSSGGEIEGTFVMDSGRRGTVRGSLQGNRVQLQRFDATRGRDRTLEGVVDAQRRSLRGTWVATELGSGEQTSGIWRAERIAP